MTFQEYLEKRDPELYEGLFDRIMPKKAPEVPQAPADLYKPGLFDRVIGASPERKVAEEYPHILKQVLRDFSRATTLDKENRVLTRCQSSMQHYWSNIPNDQKKGRNPQEHCFALRDQAKAGV